MGPLDTVHLHRMLHRVAKALFGCTLTRLRDLTGHDTTAAFDDVEDYVGEPCTLQGRLPRALREPLRR